MIVGLPGTGIGGLYYFALALWMPIRELGRALRGRSEARRLRVIVCVLCLVAMILGALGLEAWLLREAFLRVPRIVGASAGQQASMAQVVETAGLTRAAGIASVATLGGMLLLLAALRLLVPRRPAQSCRLRADEVA